MPRKYFTRAAQRAGTEAGVVRVNQLAVELAPIIAELRAAGITSKKGIARAPNQRAVRTPRGVGEWRPIQAARVLAWLTGRGTPPCVS
jgi:hypothetical protein